jgi:hypothetical protein
MSTQPIGRRRLRPVGPRIEKRRLVSIAALIAVVFTGAFVIAHTNGAADSATERLPPSLPRVSTPVPAVLTPAPPIELAVQPPPEPPKRHVAPRARTAPAVTAPSIAPVAPVQAAPVQAPPVHTTPAPAPTPSPAPSAPSKSKPGSGGSSGTSFESSG